MPVGARNRERAKPRFIDTPRNSYRRSSHSSLLLIFLGPRDGCVAVHVVTAACHDAAFFPFPPMNDERRWSPSAIADYANHIRQIHARNEGGPRSGWPIDPSESVAAGVSAMP